MLKEESGLKNKLESGSFTNLTIIPESGLPESGITPTTEIKKALKKTIVTFLAESGESGESGIISSTKKSHPVKIYTPEESNKILIKDENLIINEILKAKTTEELQNQFKIFNLSQGKRNALRISRLNNLLDKIEDQAFKRFTRNPNAISNKEVLDYYTIIAEQIGKAQGIVDKSADEQKPTIQITQQKIENKINVNSDLDRDGKERVLTAIAALLNKKSENQFKALENNSEKPEEKTVSNNNDNKEIIEVDLTKEK